MNRSHLPPRRRKFHPPQRSHSRSQLLRFSCSKRSLPGPQSRQSPRGSRRRTTTRPTQERLRKRRTSSPGPAPSKHHRCLSLPPSVPGQARLPSGPRLALRPPNLGSPWVRSSLLRARRSGNQRDRSLSRAAAGPTRLRRPRPRHLLRRRQRMCRSFGKPHPQSDRPPSRRSSWWRSPHRISRARTERLRRPSRE